MKMPSKTWLIVPIALAVVRILTSCSGREFATRSSVTVDFDTSVSSRPNLPLFLRIASRLAGDLHPHTTALAMFRMDSEVHEFYRGVVPSSQREFQAAAIEGVREQSSGPGTHPLRFWRVAVPEMEHSAVPTVVVVFGDGQNDDKSTATARELNALARRLAECPHVRRVCFWGVEPKSRAEIYRTFGCLGGRLEVKGLRDIDTESVARALQSSTVSKGGNQ